MSNETDAAFLRDLAGRMYRMVTPAMGFDQHDTDQLHRIARDLSTPSPDSGERMREALDSATKAAQVAEVCAILATRYDSEGNAQIGNFQRPTKHRIAHAYEQHLIAIRQAITALQESVR